MMKMVARRLVNTSIILDNRQWTTVAISKYEFYWTRPFEKEGLGHPILQSSIEKHFHKANYEVDKDSSRKQQWTHEQMQNWGLQNISIFFVINIL